MQPICEYRVVWKRSGGIELVKHWASRNDAVTHLEFLLGPLEYAYLETRTITISDWQTDVRNGNQLPSPSVP